MGCSAAKNSTAMDDFERNRDGENGSAIRQTSENVMLQLVPDNIPAQLLENATVNNVHRGVNGLSFEIAFEGKESEDRVVKKHPPKRVLERLEEPLSSPVTLDKLQGKLDEAEIRRQKILAQRKHSAKMIIEKSKKQEDFGSFGDDGDDDFLEIPLRS